MFYAAQMISFPQQYSAVGLFCSALRLIPHRVSSTPGHLSSSQPETPFLLSNGGQKIHQWNLSGLVLAMLCPPPAASSSSDLQRSAKDLLGSSLNQKNRQCSAYWSPCCVDSLTHWAQLAQTGPPPPSSEMQSLTWAHSSTHRLRLSGRNSAAWITIGNNSDIPISLSKHRGDWSNKDICTS